MCLIWRNSLLVHVAYPQILGTNGLVVVVVVCKMFEDITFLFWNIMVLGGRLKDVRLKMLFIAARQ